MKCRLCYNLTSEEYQNYLHDEDGQYTEVYEITLKYFDPVLINIDDKNDSYNFSNVICNVCWGYIREFNEFQQSVLRTQNQLMEDKASLLVEVNNDTGINVEVENEDDLEEMNAIGGEIVLILENSTNEYYKNDDATEDNVKDLLKEDNIEPTGDYNDSKNCDNKKIKNVKKSRNVKVNPNKETSRSPKKRSCRKVPPEEKNNCDTKSAHYNSLKTIREINNFITEVKPYLECDICKELLPSYNELRKHFKEKHQAKCFVVCCGKKMYRRYLLVEHLRMHVNPNIFKCDICDVISSSSRSLHSHKRFMHGEINMLECEVCHKQFKTKPILNRHMDIHNDGSKDFKCPECDRCYSSDYQLKAHINKFHNETQICEQCGKVVHGKTALKLHIIHQHSGNKPYKLSCDKCDAKLASKKGLKAHKLSFHNDLLTAFICKECGKIASSITALLHHKKYVHEMTRKHKCQYCDKAFKKKSNLKEHISTHTGQHLYQCYHCPLTFGNSANMHTHRKKAHPVEFTLSRENRVVVPKIDLNSVTNEVIL